VSAAVVRGLIVLGAVLVLGAVNFSIQGKEHIKAHGELIYLELAPVDPRSLMQGDYMALRFTIAASIDVSQRSGNTVALKVDERRVASVAPAAATGTLRMRYRVRGGRVWLGTNAFFFEEGSAARFAPARYGEFRTNPDSGEAVLVGLRDGSFRKL